MMLLLKSVGWRIIGILTTTAIAFALTGNFSVALGVGSADAIVKIFLYWLYDVLWAKFAVRRVEPSVIWFTGLSGSGKTTLARELKRLLDRRGSAAMILDGDEIRDLFPGTGFDEASRKAHILRVSQMAQYLQAQGITAIVSLISPYRDVRDQVRLKSRRFIEVYVSTPLDVCERRDPKGLYRKARAGEIAQFTGISAPYEAPLSPECTLDTSSRSVGDCAQAVLKVTG